MLRAFAAAALLPNGQVLMAGGSNADGTSNTISRAIQADDRQMGSHNEHALQSWICRSTAGQWQRAGLRWQWGVLYDPSTKQWSSTGPLYYSDGAGSTAVLLPNGAALMYGN